VLAVGFYQLVTGTGSYDVAAGTYRLSGVYGVGAGELDYKAEVDSTTLLMYLACLATPLVFERKWKGSVLAIVISASSVILLLASESRAPLLAFLAAGLVMLSKSKMKLKYGSLLLLAVCAAQLSPRVYSRFGGPLLEAPTKFWKNDISVNATQRMATWVMLVHELADAKTLVIGRGFGFVDNYLVNVLDAPPNLYARVVHNDFLRLLLDLGLTGAILLVGQLILLYRTGSRLFSRARDSLARSLGVSLCAMVTGFAIVAATVNMYTTAQYAVFWIFTGLILAATKWTPLAQPAPSARSGTAPVLQRG
jgi:O-antigen ligase